MHIRVATEADRDGIVDVWHRSVRATHRFLSDTDVEGLYALVRGGALWGLELWVLEVDGRLAGFVGIDRGAGDGVGQVAAKTVAGQVQAASEGAGVVRIEALFLSPEVQRRGGGRRLVEHVQGLQPGATLEVNVNEQNPAALAFYEAMGFGVVGRSALDGQGRAFPLLHLRRVGG